jgi:hypothetical protein
MKRDKKIVVVWEKGLTDEQRRNYEKEHPGYRLSFYMRYPDFPIYFSIAVLLLVIILSGMCVLLRLH